MSSHRPARGRHTAVAVVKERPNRHPGAIAGQGDREARLITGRLAVDVGAKLEPKQLPCSHRPARGRRHCRCRR